MIKMGFADAMIAGGADAILSIPAFAGFEQLEILSKKHNDSPETACRPFDRDRDGYVLGEGAAVLCIEELEHAKKRGAKIYAEITGFGFTLDSYDLTNADPEGISAAAAIENTIHSAKINKEDVDLINAYGASTQAGDLIEAKIINRIFSNNINEILVHSTKSMTGNTIGASGCLEAIAAILAIEKNVIHPSINVFNQDAEINLNVVKEPMEKKVNNILCNSFGFAGQNAVVMVSRFNDN